MLLVGALVIVGLSVLFYFIFWRMRISADDDYAPDGVLLHHLTFFLACLGAMATGRFVISGPSKPAVVE